MVKLAVMPIKWFGYEGLAWRVADQKAKREAKFIVEEKITTAQEETMQLIKGGSPNAMVKNYRRKVKANKRRLSK